MPSIRINLDDKALRESFALLGKDINVSAMEILANEALKRVDQRFRSEGPTWAKLKPSTLKRRRNLGSVKILQDTGRLRNSIVAPQNAPGGIWAVAPNQIEVGSNLVYAATHQYGRGPIPARPYVPEEDELAKPLQQKLERLLSALIEGK